MRIKDKPATGTPSRLLGLILMIAGGLFLGDFAWALATYSPSVEVASLTALSLLGAGMLAGAVLIGVGTAAVLHSTGHLEVSADLDWGRDPEKH
jgi:hypothetical protein